MRKRMFSLTKQVDIGFMLHPGRCGSTVVGRMVGQHPVIKWDGEILTTHRKIHNSVPSIPGSEWRKLLRERKRLCRRPKLGIEIKTGELFKAGNLPGQIEGAVKTLSEFSSFPPIFLHRTNHLLRRASGLEAGTRRKYNFRRGEQPEIRRISLPRIISDPTYRIEHMDIAEWLTAVELAEEAIAECIIGLGGIVLNYESNVESDPNAAYETVVSHLGETPMEASVEFIKINSLSLKDRVCNFDEVRSWLTKEQADRYCR